MSIAMPIEIERIHDDDVHVYRYMIQHMPCTPTHTVLATCISLHDRHMYTCVLHLNNTTGYAMLMFMLVVTWSIFGGAEGNLNCV